MCTFLLGGGFLCSFSFLPLSPAWSMSSDYRNVLYYIMMPSLACRFDRWYRSYVCANMVKPQSLSGNWDWIKNLHWKPRVNHLTHLSHSVSLHGQKDSFFTHFWVILSVYWPTMAQMSQMIHSGFSVYFLLSQRLTVKLFNLICWNWSSKFSKFNC